jgi:manganese-dependent ADP-ribose/CDP-alcohol diphosphatase
MTSNEIRMTESPLLSFGIVTDLHYMDRDDGVNFDGTQVRRFRQSLQILQSASNSFKNNQTHFNMLLGDILDGKAKKFGIQEQCIETILRTTEATFQDWYFTLGNHEFYNFCRSELYQKLIPKSHLSICTPSSLYYHFSPVPGFRCIVLDGYDISIMESSTTQYAQYAENLIRTKNHNYASGNHCWFEGIEGNDMRYVPFNGGIGSEQINWLRETLINSSLSKEKCFIFSHIPIFLEASKYPNLLWNCEEVLEIMHKSVPRGTILACISGHDHDGGYARDECGIHHIVPPSPIECDEGEISFGRMDVFDGEMCLEWSGKTPIYCNWPIRFEI